MKNIITKLSISKTLFSVVYLLNLFVSGDSRGRAFQAQHKKQFSQVYFEAIKFILE